MTDGDPWDLDRPDVLLRWLQAQAPFDEPAAYLVRVDEQQPVAWTRLWSEPPLDEYPHRTRLGEEALARLGVPEWTRQARPLVVPVIVRPGHLVWTFDEQEVFLSLRYAGNRYAFMHHDFLVVTEHGWWWGFLDHREPEPRAAWSEATIDRLTA
jgi:hypothetical protein